MVLAIVIQNAVVEMVVEMLLVVYAVVWMEREGVKTGIWVIVVMVVVRLHAE